MFWGFGAKIKLALLLCQPSLCCLLYFSLLLTTVRSMGRLIQICYNTDASTYISFESSLCIWPTTFV